MSFKIFVFIDMARQSSRDTRCYYYSLIKIETIKYSWKNDFQKYTERKKSFGQFITRSRSSNLHSRYENERRKFNTLNAPNKLNITIEKESKWKRN